MPSISLPKMLDNSIKFEDLSKVEVEAQNSGSSDKISKLQTLIEVLKCELGRPGRTSRSPTPFTPTKQWTPIHYAVYHRRKAALAYFLHAGKRLDFGPDIPPLLCVAVSMGHIDMARKLCVAGADVTATLQHSGETALHLAVKHRQVNVLKLLLQYKSNPNARALTRETPLHYAVARSENIDVVIALLQHGASCEALDHEGSTPAMAALQKGHTKIALAIVSAARNKQQRLQKERDLLLQLLETPRDRTLLGTDQIVQILEVACPAGTTPLIEGIKSVDIAVVRLILERGADPNKATASGIRPLFAAFDASCAPVVQALVDHGADVTLPNPHGLNVLQALLVSPLSSDESSLTRLFDILISRGASVQSRYSDGTTLLHRAVGLSRIVQQLIHQGIDVNARDDSGNTSLHTAAASPPCVKILLKHGADLDSLNNKGLTPLLHAIKSGLKPNEPDVHYLLKKSDIRRKDLTKKTALHLAAQNGLINTVKLLLEARADSAVIDTKKRTPLMLAVLNHQWEIVPLLAAQPGINSWDENGMTALHYIAATIPKAPSTWQDIAVAVTSFCRGAVSRSIRDQSGATPLIQAVRSLPEEGLPIIDALVIPREMDRGNCVAHEDHQQRNALYYAVTMGKLCFVEVLLKHGAPFCLTDWTLGKGPLAQGNKWNKDVLRLFAEREWLRRMASLRRRVSIINEQPTLSQILPVDQLEAMLIRGLDPNHLPQTANGSILWLMLHNSIGRSTSSSPYFLDALKVITAFDVDLDFMLRCSTQRQFKKRNSQPIMLAVHPLSYIIEQFPQVALEVVVLLLDRGAKLNIASPLYDGQCPLHCAVRSQRFDLVKELVDRGADVNSLDVKKRTPLCLAADKSSFEILDFLLQSGASVNAQDSEGNSPLHLASAAGHAKIVSSLVRSGSKASSCNRKGLTPLQCLPGGAPSEDQQIILSILLQSEEAEHAQNAKHSTNLATRTTSKSSDSAKQAGQKEASVLRKQTQDTSILRKQPLITPPATTITQHSLETQSIRSHPSTALSSPGADTPLSVSKQLMSIHYTSPAPPVSPKIPVSNTPSPTPSLELKKSTELPRADSGLEITQSGKVTPPPELERSKFTFDQVRDRSSIGDELASWLSVSRMLEKSQ